MIAIRHKLQQLTIWIQVNRIEIQEYISRYPFVQFKQMQASNHFKNKLGQIISLIISEIVPPTTINTSAGQFGRNLHENTAHINSLCIIKRNLDQIKCAFLGLDNLKSFNTTLILRIVQQSVNLTNKNLRFQQKNQKSQPFSFTAEPTIIAYHKKIYQEKLKSWNDQYQNLNENEKTKKIRAKLYAQMNEYLFKKEKDLKQRRQKKSFSHYFEDKQQDFQILQTKNKKQEQKQRKRIFPSNYITEQRKNKNFSHTIQSYKSNTKRKYKYLQGTDQVQYLINEKAINHLSVQKQQQNQNDLKLPQTSDSNKNQQISQLEIELSKFQAEKELQQSVNMELNFDFLLSKIRQDEKNDIPSGETWQNFDQDSIEKQKQVQNLQDSLQLMKFEQNVNNSGYFGVKQSNIALLQNHQYSFSNL